MAIKPVDPFDCIVFGATGDLTLRKLMPALYNRLRDGQIPNDARIIGAARSELDDQAFRARTMDALKQHVAKPDMDQAVADRFIDLVHYAQGDAGKPGGLDALSALLAEQPDRIRVFYLATSPGLYGPICENLKAAGLVTENSRVVLEKPIGHDLKSAEEINDVVGQVFTEAQTFRIDHYLGKETVQNLLALRFANVVFERLWNADVIDHVQITVGETVGVEGRGDYYDHSGALRDMVQNHLMQLLCLLAMEPPTSLEADSVRDEKLKVLRSLKPIAPHEVAHVTVRGQYSQGAVDGQAVPGYLADLGEGRDQPDRDVRGAEGGDPELALEQRAVLPAQRQAAAAEGERDRGAVPRRAVQRVPERGCAALAQQADHPAAARGGHEAGVDDQEPGARRPAPQPDPARHQLREGVRHPVPGCLRAAADGQRARQPDAVHAPG